MTFLATFSLAFVVSLCVASLLVLTQCLHGTFSYDSSNGVQKLHHAPTPRIGGVALLVGALAGGMALSGAAQGLWWQIGLCALPAFGIGLLEDVTKRVGVLVRLVATIFAGWLFVSLTGMRIDRVDIVLLDAILAYPWVSVALTAVAIGGIANAINIIDGVNGLSSGTALIVLSGFGIVAFEVGDTELLGLCLVASGAVAGFFVLNFPSGKLFLGDAGAYGLGVVLAAIAIALPWRNAEVTPMAGFLGLAYPVLETFVTIHRRSTRLRAHPVRADRLHLHSLLYLRPVKRLALALRVPHMRSALTAVIMWSFPLLSSMVMVQSYESLSLSIAGVAGLTVVYLLVYRRVALIGGGAGLMSGAAERVSYQHSE